MRKLLNTASEATKTGAKWAWITSGIPLGAMGLTAAATYLYVNNASGWSDEQLEQWAQDQAFNADDPTQFVGQAVRLVVIITLAAASVPASHVLTGVAGGMYGAFSNYRPSTRWLGRLYQALPNEPDNEQGSAIQALPLPPASDPDKSNQSEQPSHNGDLEQGASGVANGSDSEASDASNHSTPQPK